MENDMLKSSTADQSSAQGNAQHGKNLIILGCCLFIVICFAYSVFLRNAWFNRPLDTGQGWLTGHSVSVTRNWLKEGAFRLKFMQVMNPASIEFDTLLSRDPYISYPPGAFIPVFLLAKISHAKDLIVLFRGYNLFSQLLISILLFLTMFHILNYFRSVNIANVFFSVVPSMIYLFTPETLYWHQNEFFSDQAVLVLFASFIYFEIRYFLSGKQKGWEKLFFAGIIFLGTLTDWLFLFVILATVILRSMLLRKELSIKQAVIDSLVLIIPMLLGITLFFYQIISTLGFAETLHKLFHIFVHRYLMGHDGIVTNFFEQHFVQHGGNFGKTLCFSGVACVILFTVYYFLARSNVVRNTGKMLRVYAYLIGLSILPCLFQVVAFQQHSVTHDYAVLKWAIPLSLIPFGIMPIFLSRLLKPYKYYTQMTWLIFFSCVILLSNVFYKTARNYKQYFQSGGGDNKEIGELVKRNVVYNDVCFSFDFDISVFPTQRLAYSEKRVYKINNFFEAKAKLFRFIKKDATGKIFIAEDRWADLKEEAGKFCSKIDYDSKYYICTIADSK